MTGASPAARVAAAGNVTWREVPLWICYAVRPARVTDQEGPGGMSVLAIVIVSVLGVAGLTSLIWGAWYLAHPHPSSSSSPAGTEVSAWDFRVSGPWPIMMVVVGALMLVASGYLAVHTAGGSPSASSSQASSVPASTVSATPPTTASASPTTQGQPKVTLAYPPDGTQVSRSVGFTASGPIIGPLGTYTVWLLDHPSIGYVVDVKASVSNGRWTATDRQLGGPSDQLPFKLIVVAVLADAECANTLAQLNSSVSGDITGELPAGCALVGKTTVNVARP